VYPYRCTGVYVGCVSIDNPSSSPNTDGVDPDSSSDVLIEHADISVGDDCIAVVSSATVCPSHLTDCGG